MELINNFFKKLIFKYFHFLAKDSQNNSKSIIEVT